MAVDGRYTDYALASRLSYLLWDTTPDDQLLDAAEAGMLTTDDGLRAHIEPLIRLDPNPPSSDFEQWFDLEKLEQLNKDLLIFTAMTTDLGEMARRETPLILLRSSSLRTVT